MSKKYRATIGDNGERNIPKYPKDGTPVYNLLQAVALNPGISPGAARCLYHGSWTERLRYYNATQIAGKWYLDADLREHVTRDIEKHITREIAQIRNIDLMNRKPYIMPPIQSTRLGALDYQNIPSRHI